MALGQGKGGGPKPIPTKLKLLKGEKNKDRINTKEPKAIPIIGKPPAFLNKQAKKEWKKVAPKLERLGIATELDGSILAAYCDAYSIWLGAVKQFQETGE